MQPGTSMPKVCMFVYNNFLHDSRVEKEAETLNRAGYQVTVLALLDLQTRPNEERNGVKIIRVPGDPSYKRLLSWLDAWKGEVSRVSYHLPSSLERRDAFTPVSQDTDLNRSRAGSLRKLEKDNGPAIFSRKLYTFVSKRLKIIFKTFLMPFHRQLCFLSFYLKVYNATAGERYDIYHAHDLNTLPVAYLAAKRDQAKLVYDSHELYVERNKLEPSSRLWKFILRCLESFLARRANVVLTVNESLAQEMTRRYGIPQPGVVMNTPLRVKQAGALATTNSTLRNKLGISPDLEVLLYVGRITFNRGLEQLILSLKHLEDCCLVCMGGGNEKYKRGLLSLAKEIGVGHRFFFFGPVPSDEVIYFAAGTDLGVAAIANSCLSYYHCSPNKLFEYMNAGLPVIASAFPELKKVVLEHEIGLTFDPSDPEDIARAARQILDDPEERERMRQNALEAASLYNWEKESLKLLQLYASIYNSSCPLTKNTSTT